MRVLIIKTGDISEPNGTNNFFYVLAEGFEGNLNHHMFVRGMVLRLSVVQVKGCCLLIRLNSKIN